jgi:ribosomal-protein-alanine N-acetyltransferase
MMVEGRTERLILRPQEAADAERIQELFPQWEIVRFLMNRVPWPYPPDGALCYIRDIALPQMERGEAWHWTIRLSAEPAQIIGSISLIRGEKDNRGFWMDPQWQGQGLMSEACVWVNDFWFDTLGFEVLRVSKAVGNTTSRRISEKQGMRLWPPAFRDPGNHRRRVARVEGPPKVSRPSSIVCRAQSPAHVNLPDVRHQVEPDLPAVFRIAWQTSLQKYLLILEPKNDDQSHGDEHH